MLLKKAFDCVPFCARFNVYYKICTINNRVQSSRRSFSTTLSCVVVEFKSHTVSVLIRLLKVILNCCTAFKISIWICPFNLHFPLFVLQEKFHKQVYGISINSSKTNLASAIIENPEMLKIQQRHAMKQQTLANTNKPPAPPPPLIPSGTPTKQDSSAMNGKCFENVVYHRQPKLAQCASSANMKICLYCAVGEVQCKELCPNERHIGIR